MRQLLLHFDGSCAPKNPGGTAAYGFHLQLDGDTVSQGHDVIGTGPGMTNNLAEFKALAKGLEAVLTFTRLWRDPANVLVRGDSNLVINVMNGSFKPKPQSAYYMAFVEARANDRLLAQRKIGVEYEWVRRERNTICDDLSKAHLTDTERHRGKSLIPELVG